MIFLYLQYCFFIHYLQYFYKICKYFPILSKRHIHSCHARLLSKNSRAIKCGNWCFRLCCPHNFLFIQVNRFRVRTAVLEGGGVGGGYGFTGVQTSTGLHYTSVCKAGNQSFLLLSVWVTGVPVKLFLYTATCFILHTHIHTNVYTDPEQSPHSAPVWNFLLLLS